MKEMESCACFYYFTYPSDVECIDGPNFFIGALDGKDRRLPLSGNDIEENVGKSGQNPKLSSG
jgi:hypothetical protein